MQREFKEIIGKINKMNVIHRIYIQKAAIKNGLYFGQLAILENIIKNENCTQKDLSTLLQVSPPSIATSIKRMKKAGLIEKSVDESDCRYNRITPTDLGRELAKNCREDFNKVDRQMFEGFSSEECSILSDYIERLITNLSTEEFKDKNFFSLLQEEKKLHGRKDNNE